MRRFGIGVTSIASTIGSLVVATATVQAAPVTAPSSVSSASRDGTQITSFITDATFLRTASGLEVIDSRGAVVERVPDAVVLNGVSVPLRINVSRDGRQANFVPQITGDLQARISRAMRPSMSPQKSRALDNAIWHVANGLNRAGTVSAAIGAGVGAVVGGIVGLIVGCGVVAGCVWLAAAGAVGGAAVGAAVGGTIGTSYGDPNAGQAVLDWINTP